MSMCAWPLEGVCNWSLAPVVSFSTHGILRSCANWNEAFQAYASNCMHGMVQTEAWLQHWDTLWNVSVTKRCKHYQKPTASYHFGGYVLPGILNPYIDSSEKKLSIHTHINYILYTRSHSHMLDMVSNRHSDHLFAFCAFGAVAVKIKTCISFCGLVIH